MSYPLFRLKLVLAPDWHQFNNWLIGNPIEEGEKVVYVRQERVCGKCGKIKIRQLDSV